jgi:hypothetical protein
MSAIQVSLVANIIPGSINPILKLNTTFVQRHLRRARRERGSHQRSNTRPEQLDCAQHFRVRQRRDTHLERDTGNAP